MSRLGVGTVVLFGIVFAPVYAMLLGWFLERPRRPRLALIGVGYLVSITAVLWLGGLALAALIGLLFF